MVLCWALEITAEGQARTRPRWEVKVVELALAEMDTAAIWATTKQALLSTTSWNPRILKARKSFSKIWMMSCSTTEAFF